MQYASRVHEFKALYLWFSDSENFVDYGWITHDLHCNAYSATKVELLPILTIQAIKGGSEKVDHYGARFG